jgi:hypothetical protein
MENKKYLIVTSISKPNESLKHLAEGAGKKNFNFLLIGDTKSPPDFELSNCKFYNIQQQEKLDFQFAEACPKGHYARKNIGYLIAISKEASVIKETDDDNLPLEDFWDCNQQNQTAYILKNCGWINIYSYFSKQYIWPRGFALEKIKTKSPELQNFEKYEINCPIHQGLADNNPDVDALYRLLFPLPQNFKGNLKLALSNASWCPFNSQNTTWFPDAYPLLYLPAYCSFRMTDIWRSFVAQKILHANNQAVLFHKPTVVQERNEHNLMKDFNDEIIGYQNNRKIQQEFDKIPLKTGKENTKSNMFLCYEKLIQMQLVGKKEIALLTIWFNDLEKTAE